MIYLFQLSGGYTEDTVLHFYFTDIKAIVAPIRKFIEIVIGLTPSSLIEESIIVSDDKKTVSFTYYDPYNEIAEKESISIIAIPFYEKAAAGA